MKKRKYEKPKMSVKKLSRFFFACLQAGTCLTEVNKNNVASCNPS